MKQMYYTWCEAGKGLQPNGSGFQIRAASAGIEASRLKAVGGYAGYALPAGMTPENVAPAPIRLAFLSTAEAGRLLCHCHWIGHDPGSGRDDNYFAHVLLDSGAAGLDAQHAIQTWGSSH